MNEHELEPVPGLPERLPPGERLLWQGSPAAWTLARRALHIDKVALYFGVLLLWRATGSVTAALWLLPLALTALGLLGLFAWGYSRTTLYTITDRRVVLRVGIALPLTINLPFARIDAAALKVNADGSGDIPLCLHAGERVSYLLLWPHVRPWQLRQPQPMLRAIPQAAAVADVLAQALAGTLLPGQRQAAAAQAAGGSVPPRITSAA